MTGEKDHATRYTTRPDMAGGSLWASLPRCRGLDRGLDDAHARRGVPRWLSWPLLIVLGGALYLVALRWR